MRSASGDAPLGGAALGLGGQAERARARAAHRPRSWSAFTRRSRRRMSRIQGWQRTACSAGSWTVTLLPATVRVQRYYGPRRAGGVGFAAAARGPAAPQARADGSAPHQADAVDLAPPCPRVRLEARERGSAGSAPGLSFSWLLS